METITLHRIAEPAARSAQPIALLLHLIVESPQSLRHLSAGLAAETLFSLDAGWLVVPASGGSAASSGTERPRQMHTAAELTKVDLLYLAAGHGYTFLPEPT